jgi:lysine 2,3-aminomutase
MKDAQPESLTPPVRRQFEDVCEEGSGGRDPLGEGSCSPAEGLIQRYEGRALILVTDRCFARCSFCNRRFFVQTGEAASPPGTLKVNLESALRFISGHGGIREVLLSGGDPLTLGDDELRSLLERLREIPAVALIRIGTRAPMARPRRITPALAGMLASMRPLVMSVHFNHPDELTRASLEACRLLVDRGIPLLNQAVLLRQVNDDPEAISDLCWKLALAGVRPYYLFQCDRVAGTSRFWVPLGRGIEIARRLREMLPGHAVPHYVVDLPGREGKAWIDPLQPPRRVEGGYELIGSGGRPVFYPD